MTTEHFGDLTIIRHTQDPLISIYRGSEHLGLIHLPPVGLNPYTDRVRYLAGPTASTKPTRECWDEAEAVDYLAA